MHTDRKQSKTKNFILSIWKCNNSMSRFAASHIEGVAFVRVWSCNTGLQLLVTGQNLCAEFAKPQA